MPRNLVASRQLLREEFLRVVLNSVGEGKAGQPSADVDVVSTSVPWISSFNSFDSFAIFDGGLASSGGMSSTAHDEEKPLRVFILKT